MWTWLAIISIAVCLILVILCYIWLYFSARKLESKETKEKQAFHRIAELIGTVIDSQTDTDRIESIKKLREYIKTNKRLNTDILSKMLIEGLLLGGNEDDGAQKALVQVYEELKPQEYYSALLRIGSPSEKAFACKMLASFYQEGEIPEIRKHITSRNKELTFNAARALAILGDEDGLCKFILSCEDEFQYSHRIILELFNIYSGDVKSLALKCLEKSSDYLKSVIVKAIAKYKIKEFEQIYLQYAKHKDSNIRVASVKALSEIGDPKYEQALITATHDTMWFVRSAAVKGLGKINTLNSRQALLKAVQDKEWWVRYNAARTLVEMEEGLELAEKVLSGYDRFAADAVKYALYKTYDTTTEEI